jgi:hypothetical protein
MFADTSNFALEAQEALKNFKTRKAKVKSKKTNLGSLESVLDFHPKIEPNRLELTLPIRTISEANSFEPWQKKHKRHKNQKKLVFFALLEVKHLIKLPCKIKYIRYAPKELDVFENLPMSFKYINDQVCAEITGDHRPGRADGSKEITQSCDQIKSKQYAVKIIIEF